jgi:soluble lytic murein transglycosylase-like protein
MAAVRRCMLLIAVALAVSITSPAGADPLGCDEAWEQLATIVRQGNRRGLTLERIEQINEYLPIVRACANELVAEWDSGVDRWGPLVASYFNPEDVARALCLMELESAGDPGARNPSSGASGLMQVMPVWAGHFGYSPLDLFDPWTNLEVAARIRDQQGWGAWSPYVRGLCR